MQNKTRTQQNDSGGAERFFDRLSQLPVVRIIQRALTLLIPALLIGSFALIVKSFPVPIWQTFLETPAGQVVFRFADLLFQITFNQLSLYMAVSVGYCAATERSGSLFHVFGTILSSLGAFLLSVGIYSDSFDRTYLSVNGMFIGILAPLIASFLYLRLFPKDRSQTFGYTEGADYSYNSAIASILPLLIVLALFGVLQLLLNALVGVSCVQELFVRAADALFRHIGSKFGQGFVFVLLSSLLWFFGVHGSDVLNTINEGLFISYMDENIAAVSAGQVAPNILTKTFIDVFVLMGGCGAAMCLLAAIVIAGRQNNNRRLAGTAACSMIFNINELMIFGLPVIFKPILFIPFLITPMLLFLTSYGAVAAGLVPIPVATVEWTTPIFLSGYTATGSFSGVLLQLSNLVIGTLIYIPFVRMMEREQLRSSRRTMSRLIDLLRRHEAESRPILLRQLSGAEGTLAKGLMLDFRRALKDKRLTLFYQPQFDERRRCVGAEALLRWNHALFGSIYPPLIIQLATETELLPELETRILKQVYADSLRFRVAEKTPIPVSVNLTALAIHTPEILTCLEEICRSPDFISGCLCIEITEQSAFESDKGTSDFFTALHRMGYLLAIDDFSMGHTSLRYLQENTFDLVKLDGSLVREMGRNDRCGEIIRSIVYLSNSLGFRVLAEYVETEEEMQMLAEIGCVAYQGWLFSPALPAEEYRAFFAAHESAPFPIPVSLSKKKDALD